MPGLTNVVEAPRPPLAEPLPTAPTEALIQPAAMQTPDVFAAPDIVHGHLARIVGRQPNTSVVGRLLAAISPASAKQTKQGTPDALHTLLTRYQSLFSPEAIKLLKDLPRHSHQTQMQASRAVKHLLYYMADYEKYGHHFKPLLRSLAEMGLCLTTLHPTFETESIMTLAEMQQDRPGVSLATEACVSTTELGAARSVSDIPFDCLDDWVRTFRAVQHDPEMVRQLTQKVWFRSDDILKSPEALRQSWHNLAMALDPDEMVLALQAAGDVACMAQIVAAVYDASFSMQEPFLCIGFFETLAQLPTE